MPETEGAIGSVAEILFESDQDLYVYAPPGKQHFISEAVVMGAAGFLLSAFFRGVKAASEKRLEEWGRDMTKWLLDRIQSLFDNPKAEQGKKDAASAAAEAEEQSRIRLRLAPETVTRVEATLRDALVKHGVPLARAGPIAHAVAARGVAVLQAR